MPAVPAALAADGNIGAALTSAGSPGDNPTANNNTVVGGSGGEGGSGHTGGAGGEADVYAVNNGENPGWPNPNSNQTVHGTNGADNP